MKRSGNVRLLISASLLAGAAVTATALSSCSRPVQNVADDGFDPYREYTNNTYYPRLGYYHAGAHWFFPHPVNYFVPGQGYYYGGSWFPVAQTLMLLSRPDSSRAYAYLQEHRRRDDGYGYGTYHSTGGFFSGYGSSSDYSGRGYSGVGEAGVSRGGFGAAGHAAGGHGGGE